MEFERWSICWAEMKYEDAEVTKDRPIVILNDLGDTVKAAKCTTHCPRDSSDYALKFWELSGLSKPTTVRTAKIMEVPKKYIRKKSGKLKLADILAIYKLLE